MISFQEDNYSDQKKFCLSNKRCVNFSYPGLLASESLNRPCDSLWISRLKGNVILWNMAVLTHVFQNKGIVLLKSHGKKLKSTWLYLMLTFPSNPLVLDMLKLPFTYKMVLVLIIWTIPHYFVEVPNTCYPHYIPLSFVRYLDYTSLMRQGSTTILLSWQGNIDYRKISSDYVTIGRAFRNCFSFENIFLFIHKYDDSENH